MAERSSAAEPLRSSDYVAEYLDVPKRSLDAWAYRGTGPRFYRVGKHRRYKMGDVVAWLERASR